MVGWREVLYVCSDRAGARAGEVRVDEAGVTKGGAEGARESE